MTHLDTGVIKRETISVMVDAYHLACQEVKDAYDLLQKAQGRMSAAYGDLQSFDCLPRYGIHTLDAESTIKKMRQGAWRGILNRLEIEKVMSIKDLEAFRKSFEDENKIPELELSAAMDILNGMMQQAPDYAKRLVLEVFDILTPGTKEFKYKTNTKNARRAIGKKVILESMVDVEYSRTGYHVKYYQWSSDRLTAIDKVFHALDGKGVPSGYQCPLIDAINTCGASGAGQTEYFKFQCYANGNIHLAFRRLDLVSKLNQVAGINTRIAD